MYGNEGEGVWVPDGPYLTYRSAGLDSRVIDMSPNSF